MYEEIIPKTTSVVNKDGSLNGYTSVLIENRKITKSKRGWTKVYRMKYDEIARAMTSSLEYDIFAEIRDSNVPKTFVLNYNQNKIAKRLKTSRSTVSKVVKKLRDLDFIRDKDMNPFVYIPPRMIDEDISEAQEKWSNKENK